MDGNYSPFPKRILPEGEKGKDYTLLWAKAIEGNDNNEVNQYLNPTQRGKFELLQKYGSGNQPEDLYKDAFALEKDNMTNQRKGVNKLNFKIAPIAPVIKDMAIKTMSENGNRTNVVFLDDISSEEKLILKYKMQVEGEMEEFESEVNQARGMPAKQPSYAPKGKLEADIFELNGGIKLPLEVGLEQGIDYVMNYDVKWNNYISAGIKEDIFDIGIAGTRDYVDPVTKCIKVRKLEMANVILDGSYEYDFNDSQYMGEVRSMTILDVYKDYKATMGDELSEEEIRMMANNATDKTGRLSSEATSQWYDTPKSKDLTAFMPYRVDVLDFVYKSIDIIDSPYHNKGTKEVQVKGKVRDSEVASGKIIKKGDKYYKKVKSKPKKIEVEVERRGKYILGTSIVYDFGLSYDQMRDEYGNVINSYHISRTRSRSIVDRCTVNFDAIQMALLKLQSLYSQMSGAGLLIDYNALQNIMLGGEKFDPKKLIKLKNLTGDMIFSSTDAANPHDRATGTPIVELEGGIGRAFGETMSLIEFHTNQIHRNTGLNDIALAQAPNPEVTLGQSEIALSGANNAISHIYDCYKNIKTSTSYSIAVRLQYLAKKYPNHKVYSKSIGKTLWKALGKSDAISISKTGIKIIDNPSSNQVQILQQQVMMALQQQMIELQDSFYLQAMIDEGKPLKIISLILESKIEKRKQDAAKAAEANAEQNSQAQQEMIKMKAEFEQMKVEFQKGADLAIQQQKFDLMARNAAEDDIREEKVFGKAVINNTDSRA